MLECEIELLLVQRQEFYEDPKTIVREHEHLIACMKSRDFETARDAFLEHWDDLRIKLLRSEAGKLLGAAHISTNDPKAQASEATAR